MITVRYVRGSTGLIASASANGQVRMHFMMKAIEDSELSQAWSGETVGAIAGSLVIPASANTWSWTFLLSCRPGVYGNNYRVLRLRQNSMRLHYYLFAFVIFQFMLPVNAQEQGEQDAFVEANILSIFYHEFGHAVIDLMQVPIFGQEEDAADVMAVLLINELFEEEAAQDIAYDSAFGYINDPEGIEEIAYWDLHGPDEQRYYNHVCLFYGADTERRKALAEELGLPEERADSCAEEFDQAHESWSLIFDEMRDQPESNAMVFSEGSGEYTETLNQLLAEEVASLNADLTLPQQVRVIVDSCDEPNAFYDPEAVSITFCVEFIPHLETLFQNSIAQ